jgi:integrase
VALGDAYDKFVEAARDGVALNKWRRRYRPRSVEDLESVRPHLPANLTRRQPNDVKRGDLQALIDKLSAKGLSGSRVRTVINGLRSFYTWAQDHELASHDPAQRVKLPATDAKPRERVATPAEFAALLAALSKQTPTEREEKTPRTPRAALRDSVPYALAAYGTQDAGVSGWGGADHPRSLHPCPPRRA